ncbi:NTP transferase domain-containing protein [Pseudomonas putida]|uniref:NTP transferase domain-containing protein n=1 Tax=Pseudomonas putida TaxID=303 RepID=UPI0012D2B904|nr:NTP transferase domain-containing protein [Pseudomonas putida]
MIVFPMAGLSSRFTKAGYDQPKWMLPLAGRPLLDWSLLSFASFFKKETFAIVFLDRPGVGAFIEKQVTDLGISKPVLVPLDSPTRGQAHTVQLGLQGAGIGSAEDITIFNIDTIRPNYRHSDILQESEGWLECFSGEGDHWSFVKEDPLKPGFACQVVEKQRISANCSSGIYWFKSVDHFSRVYGAEEVNPQANEMFVAPLYQRMIDQGQSVSFGLISKDEIFFSGTPAEYLHAKTQEALLIASFEEFL